MEVSSPPSLVGGSQTKGEVESSDTAVSITTEQVIPEGNTYLGLLQLSTNLKTPDCLVT